MTGDWLTLALERFQTASRSVRLTLPPDRHERFWSRFVELARLKQSGLTITLLLPKNPSDSPGLRAALSALVDLEGTLHEISWSAATPLPYSLFVMDDQWALLTVGSPDDKENAGYWRLTDQQEETRFLREAFDRQAARGVWGIDPAEWIAWHDQLPHRKQTRSALGALHRGERRLSIASAQAMKRLPKRGFWLIKPRDSAYGLAEPPGILHWGQWVTREHLAIGWPEFAAEFFGRGKLPKRADFFHWMEREFPGFRDRARAYATARAFLEQMHISDRVAAVDGWIALQDVPVRFHGWGRIAGTPTLEKNGSKWPLTRPATWLRYEVDLPVEAVRAVTGLESCTYPIHRIDGSAFSRLIDLATDVRRAVADSQITLDLNYMGKINGQRELM